MRLEIGYGRWTRTKSLTIYPQLYILPQACQKFFIKCTKLPLNALFCTFLIPLMSLSCFCHVPVFFLSCSCLVPVLPLSCSCLVPVLFLSCSCLFPALSLSLPCHTPFLVHVLSSPPTASIYLDILSFKRAVNSLPTQLSKVMPL